MLLFPREMLHSRHAGGLRSAHPRATDPRAAHPRAARPCPGRQTASCHSEKPVNLLIVVVTVHGVGYVIADDPNYIQQVLGIPAHHFLLIWLAL